MNPSIPTHMLVGSLRNALTYLRARDPTPTHKPDLTFILDHARAVTSSLALHLTFGPSPGLELADHLALVHTLAVELDRIDTLARGRDLARASELVRVLAHNLELAHTYDLDTRDLDLAHDLVLVLEHALENGCSPDAVAQTGPTDDSGPVPGRVSRRLVALAARVLPAYARSRYREEFALELMELPRRERWGYALRTLSGAWELRRALTEAVRTPDGAPVRRVTER